MTENPDRIIDNKIQDLKKEVVVDEKIVEVEKYITTKEAIEIIVRSTIENEFKVENGSTPIKGVDYFTEADIKMVVNLLESNFKITTENIVAILSDPTLPEDKKLSVLKLKDLNRLNVNVGYGGGDSTGGGGGGGSGGGGAWGSITGTLSAQVDLQNALNAKQASLISGTNIKTINGTSILGSGDITVSAGAGGSNTEFQFNDSGSLAGSPLLTYDKNTLIVYIGTFSNQGILKTPDAGGGNTNGVSMHLETGSGENGGRLDLQGGDSSANGHGGDIQITGGNGDTAGRGGDINCTAGDGGSGGGGGTFYFYGGYGSGTGNGGDVYLGAGGANGSGTQGHVIIQDPNSGANAIFDQSLMTGSHTYAFPDASGTFALETTYKNGINSFNGASGNQVIAHGLGTTPKRLIIRGTANSGTSFACLSYGVYNGTTTSTSWIDIYTSDGTSSTDIIYLSLGGSDIYSATVTMDGTNITLAWTKTGSPVQANFIWAVEG